MFKGSEDDNKMGRTRRGSCFLCIIVVGKRKCKISASVLWMCGKLPGVCKRGENVHHIKRKKPQNVKQVRQQLSKPVFREMLWHIVTKDKE